MVRLRRRKPQLPEREPEPVAPKAAPRVPDLILDGRPMWVSKANPEAIAQWSAEAARERAIEAARRRKSQPQPYGHMWMDI